MRQDNAEMPPAARGNNSSRQSREGRKVQATFSWKIPQRKRRLTFFVSQRPEVEERHLMPRGEQEELEEEGEELAGSEHDTAPSA